MLKNFVKYVSFPFVAKKDGLSNLFRQLKQLEKSQYRDRDTILRYQFQKIKNLLIHAYNNTDFYKLRFDEAGFNPYEFKDLADIKKIPILTKEQIRDNLASLTAKNYKQSDLHSSETGGTTGAKMKFYRDNASLSPKEAALYRFEKWTGWDFGERMGLVWPATEDYVGHYTLKARVKNELSGRQVVFPAAIMDEKSLANYVCELQRKRPTMIRAFTTPMYELAKYIKNQDISINLKGIITTGEPLFDHQRKTIRSAFECSVFDSYRSREAGPIAQECEKHDGMHINAENLYVEIAQLETKIPVNDEIGDIIITDMWNYGMPMIRYKMGDMGTLSDGMCSCGRGLPILKNIAGRTADIFYTPGKKCVAAVTLVLYLVDEAPGLLGQVQVIQDKLDHLTIRMTKDPPPTEQIKRYQKKTVRRLFGNTMKVSFEEVDEIPREKSGKYRFTKCLVSENAL